MVSELLMDVEVGCLSWVQQLFEQKGIVILMYHRINDALSPGELVVSVNSFRRQMRYLKKHCQVISLDDLCEYFIGGKPLVAQRKPRVFVTIDDGYRDTYTQAFPILKLLGLPATVFLATGFVGTDKCMARYKDMPRPDMMNWDEVKEMSENGITFAPHTHDHPHLLELTSNEQKGNIVKSMRVINEHGLNKSSSQVFCYPYGEYNQDTLKILKDLGFGVALTVTDGVNWGRENPLELKRRCVDGRYSLMKFMSLVFVAFTHGVRWRINLIKDKYRMLFKRQ